MAEHQDNRHHQVEIHIVIGDKNYTVHTKQMTGAQIKALGGIPTEYQLFLEQKGDDKPIVDNHSVELHDGMHFYGVPPATFGA